MLTLTQVRQHYAAMLHIAQSLGTPLPVTRGQLAAHLVLDHGYFRLHAHVVALLII
jgi:hypothetical protein